MHHLSQCKQTSQKDEAAYGPAPSSRQGAHGGVHIAPRAACAHPPALLSSGTGVT
jgi:hypothetical protein